MNRIGILKIKAGKYYKLYHKELDMLSCGATLAEHINPAIRIYKDRFNKTMDKLKKIDKNAPKERL